MINPIHQVSQRPTRTGRLRAPLALAALFLAQSAGAVLVTDPNDARSWQGATVGTFAQLFFGADNATNRQQVIDDQLLDDGLFDTTGFTAAPMTQCVGCFGNGQSLDTTGTGSLAYTTPSALGFIGAGSAVDEHWVQTGSAIGGSVWDLGAGASTAVIFNTIDHGPLPQEAIESTVYLSNDLVLWTEAVTQRVWLEGYHPLTGVLWDGFTYAVGTDNGDTFRYASIIWGGPGALISDGDNEINGVMGASRTFTPPAVPEPATLSLLLLGALGALRRRRL